MRFLSKILLWVVISGVSIYVIGPSKEFQKCVSERNHDDAYQTSKEEVFLLIKMIPLARLNVACGFVAANENTGAITGIAGVVVAFFTFTLWLSTHKLWRAGERQAEVMKTIAEAALIGQRARIQVTPTWETDRNPSKHGTPLQYKFGTRMDNFGNTAASNIKNHIGFDLLEAEMPDDFRFPDNDVPMAVVGVLGTRQFLLGPHVPPNRYISAAEMTKIQQGQLWMYVYGWVRYFDGFPGTPERVTKFCYKIRVTGNPDMPVVFPPHRFHNCADEGCDE